MTVFNSVFNTRLQTKKKKNLHHPFSVANMLNSFIHITDLKKMLIFLLLQVIHSYTNIYTDIHISENKLKKKICPWSLSYMQTSHIFIGTLNREMSLILIAWNLPSTHRCHSFHRYHLENFHTLKCQLHLKRDNSKQYFNAQHLSSYLLSKDIFPLFVWFIVWTW